MSQPSDCLRYLQAVCPVNFEQLVIFADCPNLAVKKPVFRHTRDVSALNLNINCYFSLGAFPDDSSVSRTADRVVEMRVFALDDVGEPGKLVSVEAAMRLGTPTGKVRTSRDSVQWTYRLSRGVSPVEWPRLVAAVKAKIGVPKLECVDLSHIVRLPTGINNKDEDGRRGWKVTLEELNPDASLDVDELLLFWAPAEQGPSALKRVTGTQCVHDIKRLVALVPNPDDHNEWINVGERIKAQALNEEDGREAWHELSARSGKNNRKKDTEATWHTLHPERTRGDLLHDAAWAADPEGYMAWTLAEPSRLGAREAFNDGAEMPPGSKAKAAPTYLASSEFKQEFVSPDYLVKKLITKAFLYSLTGQTGAGKTSITLRLAATVANGGMFGGLGTKSCRVLYLAAENPVDIQMRWIALENEMGFDGDNISVFFVCGGFQISTSMAKLKSEALRVGGEFGLVVVDTGPVFLEGDDENDRVAMRKHARMFRELIEVIPGKPAVIVNVHPTKNAGVDNLLPSGGGSFLNEVDGNLTAAKSEDQTIELSWQGKWRGVEFAPLHFLLRTVTHPRLVDSDGDLMPTVVCEHLSQVRQETMEQTKLDDQAKLLAEMTRNPRASEADLAVHMGWYYADGKPYKSKAHRYVDKLIKAKLVKKHLELWEVKSVPKARVNGSGGATGAEQSEAHQSDRSEKGLNY